MAVDWQWASNFLAGGRKKYERPLYDRGLRIWKANKWDAETDIHIGWMWNGPTPFITYHYNGTTTITGGNHGTNRWPSLFSYSLRFTIQRYAGLQVIQRNFKFYLIEEDPRIMPAKIQGCRQCSQTGLQDMHCYPQTCWSLEEDGTCKRHPDVEITNNNSYSRWHTISCEHGETDHHVIKNGNSCYYCSGTKKRDYGSKPERTLWDGSPLKVRDGKIIKSAATLLERMVADYAEPIG